jgi:hypothetical protein
LNTFLSFLIFWFAASARLRSAEELELIVEEMHKTVTCRWLINIAPTAGYRAFLIPLALAIAVTLADTTEWTNE